MRSARRVGAALALGTALFAALGLGAAPAASAHPLGNFTVNRYSGLILTPGRIRLSYVLDMAEIPTFQAMSQIDADHDGSASAGERQAWADRQAPLVLSRLSLAVDGRAVGLRTIGDAMRFRAGQAGLPILYFTAAYEASVPASGAVRYRDQNYADRIGWKEITARSESGTALSGSSVPAGSVSDELRSYPVDLLSSPLSVGEASFAFHPGRAGAAPQALASGPRSSGAPVASGGSFASLVSWRLTPLALGLSLALAFAFGAVHALGPGHGKTITAAYLVGSGARRRQALVIGGAVSMMHTASVLALGAVAFVLSRSFAADRAYPWLTMVTGVVALGLGIGLVLVRVRARRRGADPWGVHLHAHGHPHDHARGHAPSQDHQHLSPAQPAAVSGRGLAALALAGGILPSPTALVVLTGAIYAHRVGYGLALIVAFSMGLAAALMGVGMVAIRVRSAVSRRLGDGFAGLIPILSAAVVAGFGVFFVTRGLLQI